MAKKSKTSGGVRKAIAREMAQVEQPRSPYAPKPRRIPIKMKKK